MEFLKKILLIRNVLRGLIAETPIKISRGVLKEIVPLLIRNFLLAEFPIKISHVVLRGALR